MKKGLTGIEILVGGLIIGGIGWGVSKVIGSGKKNEGTQEQIVRQKEAKETQDREIIADKNEYLKTQVPKRRHYQQVISDPDSTAKERNDATFDLFERSKK